MANPGATPRGPRTGSRTSGLRCVWHAAGHERVRTPAGIGCRRRARVRRRRGRGPRTRRHHRRVSGWSLHRDHGALGLRQVDPHAHPRRPRPAHERLGRPRRRRARRPRRQAADQPAPRQGRLRLSVLQPAARPRRPREHRPADVDRRAQARRGVAEPPHRHHRPARPARPSPIRALRRPAAARRRGARARLAAGGHLRRRADGQPRLEVLGRAAGRCCAARSTSSARR